jgi:hypothetical protein
LLQKIADFSGFFEILPLRFTSFAEINLNVCRLRVPGLFSRGKLLLLAPNIGVLHLRL